MLFLCAKMIFFPFVIHLKYRLLVHSRTKPLVCQKKISLLLPGQIN